MWEREKIPGYAEAQDSEQVDRAKAFLGLPERICGIDCHPLTPTHIERLIAARNGYIAGGKITDAITLQFLWIVSMQYKVGSSHIEEWIAGLSEDSTRLIFENGYDEIEDYLERAFLDSPLGRKAAPCYSFSADLITALADEPFRWTMERTMNTPVAISYQLVKCRIRQKGGILVNRRSDEVAGDWMDGLPVITRESRELVHAEVMRMVESGWEPASEMSPNCPAGSVNPAEAITWSITMRRKEMNDGEK